MKRFFGFVVASSLAGSTGQVRLGGLPGDGSVDEGSTEASVGDGGSGGGGDGSPSGPACTVNSDCTPASLQHPEVACDVTHTCVQLTTDECPLVIGDLTERDMLGPPIFIGAFATIPTMTPTADPTYLNYELAINEFTIVGKGIPAGAGSGKRTPLAIVCNDELPSQAGYDRAMKHLINDLHAAVVVAPLPSGVLATTFTNDDIDNNAGKALVINALAADSTITPPALVTSVNGSVGLLWHSLGV